MLDIQQRSVPEQLVLTEQRNVRAAELPGWLGAAMGRLGRAAEQHGGVKGPLFVVYHGRVSEDGETPVEVCAPIDVEYERAADLATRREPAHREAYVRLKKAQVDFQQIGDVCTSISQWIEARGLEGTDSPREVYFTDFAAAAPDDDVLDIAFPIR